jgi:hypothetical protein
MWRNLTRAVHRLWFDTSGGELYRRERYYMRGPGPKWHAKYAQCTSFTPSSVLAANGRGRVNSTRNIVPPRLITPTMPTMPALARLRTVAPDWPRQCA